MSKVKREIYSSKYGDFINKIPEIFETQGVVIHDGRNKVKVFDTEYGKINVKKFCIAPIGNRIIYSAGIRQTKAKRCYTNAHKILEKGFGTAEPYGYIIERKMGLICDSYFISEQIDDMAPVSGFLKDERIMKEVIKHAADMHNNNMLHRDHASGNILYAIRKTKDGEETIEFSMVDINRFAFTKVGAAKGCKALMRIIPGEFIEKYTAMYAQMRGYNENACILRMKRYRCFREKYNTLKSILKKIPGAKYIT